MTKDTITVQEILASEEWQELTRNFTNALEEQKNLQEQFWDSLTKEQQLMAFCAICRRIVKGELEDKGSYRYVLYDVFGFGTESYMLAQAAGYLAIHNLLVEDTYD